MYVPPLSKRRLDEKKVLGQGGGEVFIQTWVRCFPSLGQQDGAGWSGGSKTFTGKMRRSNCASPITAPANFFFGYFVVDNFFQLRSCANVPLKFANAFFKKKKKNILCSILVDLKSHCYRYTCKLQVEKKKGIAG